MLFGQYAAAQFAAASDGNGGTFIVDPPVAATSEPGAVATPHHR
jgi:hypothetical protein